MVPGRCAPPTPRPSTCFTSGVGKVLTYPCCVLAHRGSGTHARPHCRLRGERSRGRCGGLCGRRCAAARVRAAATCLLPAAARRGPGGGAQRAGPRGPGTGALPGRVPRARHHRAARRAGTAGVLRGGDVGARQVRQGQQSGPACVPDTRCANHSSKWGPCRTARGTLHRQPGVRERRAPERGGHGMPTMESVPCTFNTRCARLSPSYSTYGILIL